MLIHHLNLSIYLHKAHSRLPFEFRDPEQEHQALLPQKLDSANIISLTRFANVLNAKDDLIM